MYARVNTIQGAAGSFDEAVKTVRERVLPAASKIPGFAGMISLGDRATGKAIGITLWESEEALKQSEEAASSIRQGASAADGSTVVGVERFEVAVLELKETTANL